MRLTEADRETLRTLTAEFVLELRAAYLRTPQCSPLKHWDQLQDRLRAAARTTASPEEWATSMMRSLGLGALHVGGTKALRDLADAVHAKGASGAWLELLDREYGYVMAIARALAEQRRSAAEGAVNDV